MNETIINGIIEESQELSGSMRYARGVKGDKGDDGIGISDISKTSTSGKVDTYTITLTDGTTKTFTVTNGKDGANGISVSSVSINKSGHLIVVFSDGTSVDAGIAKGDTGVIDVQINGASITDEENRVANIPIGSGTNFGVFKLGSGIGISSGGGLMSQPASGSEIMNRSSTYRMLSPRTLDLAVKSAMCDGKGEAWTVSEQIAAQKRMGVGNIELIKEITLTEDVAAIDLFTTEENIELRECFVFGKVLFTSSGEKNISMYKTMDSGLNYFSFNGACNVTEEHVTNSTPWYWSRFIYPLGETGQVITLEPVPTTETLFGGVNNSLDITYNTVQSSSTHIIDNLTLRLIGSDDTNLIKAGSTFSIYGRKVR